MTFRAGFDSYMKTFLEKKFDMEKTDEIIDSDNIVRSFNTLS